MDAVWADIAVTDNSLAQCLLEIRRALGDDSQQLIRTMKRRGYMFAAALTTPVVEVPGKPAGAETQPARMPEDPVSPPWTSRNRLAIGVFVFLVIALGGLLMLWRTPRTGHEPAYEQITNFPDAAVSPALSPDGRMVAFLRSSDWFLTPDPIYVKMLPDGEPVELTRD